MVVGAFGARGTGAADGGGCVVVEQMLWRECKCHALLLLGLLRVLLHEGGQCPAAVRLFCTVAKVAVELGGGGSRRCSGGGAGRGGGGGGRGEGVDGTAAGAASVA